MEDFMLKARLFASLILICFSVSSWANCPKGAKDDSLTLSQVMRHFGRMVMTAGNRIDHGLADPNLVKTSDLQDSLLVIETAHDCIDLVLQDQSGDLYPSKAASLPKVERDQYLQKFFDHMREFSQAIGEFKQLFTVALNQKPADINFQAMKAKEDQIMAIADRSHDDLK